ncbi:hypothetical protein ACTJIJ_22035 [Niabella sp. 22666]
MKIILGSVCDSEEDGTLTIICTAITKVNSKNFYAVASALYLKTGVVY